MIRMSLKLDSMLLFAPVEVQIALPYSYFNPEGCKYKTLWAFHCALADSSLFFERLSAVNYVDENSLIIIAPSLPNSYFVNNTFDRYGDFIHQELIPVLKRYLPVSEKREENFCLGISMGAFGCLSLVLQHQELFSKIACISGFYDYRLPDDSQLRKQRKSYLLRRLSDPFVAKIFKDENQNIKHECDIRTLISELKPNDDTTKINFYCGENDLLSLNQTKQVFAWSEEQKLPCSLTLVAGEHDESSWKLSMDKAIDTFINH